MTDAPSPWWGVISTFVLGLLALWANNRGSWIASKGTAQSRADQRQDAETAQIIKERDAARVRADRLEDERIALVDEIYALRFAAQRIRLEAVSRLMSKGDHAPLPDLPPPPAE